MLTLLYHIPNSAFCCSGGLWPPKPSKRNRNQTVKDLLFRSGTRQSPTLVINLTKIGSTLSPEELHPHAWGWTAYRGTQNIRVSRSSSMRICKILRSISGAHATDLGSTPPARRGGRCVPHLREAISETTFRAILTTNAH